MKSPPKAVLPLYSGSYCTLDLEQKPVQGVSFFTFTVKYHNRRRGRISSESRIGSGRKASAFSSRAWSLFFAKSIISRSFK